MAEAEFPVDDGESISQKNDPVGKQNEKKPRKRLKKLCSQIRSQMEFYFSDANLHKDGFVKQLIDKSEDRYVPVSIFSNFNKIRELTTDMRLVVKALSTSEHLEVKEGGEYIRRKTPYTEPKDVDERTIYVESLPPDVDHDWLQQTFAPFGKVVYVSLPRYRTSGDLKGFAFIEFETKEGHEKACQMFQPIDPDDEKTARFPKYNKQLQTLQRQISVTGEKIDEKKLKRRLNTSDSSIGGESEPSPAKRQKRLSESSDTEPSEKEKGRGRKRSGDSESESVNEENQLESKKNKRLPDTQTINLEKDHNNKQLSDSETSGRKRKRCEEGEDKEDDKDCLVKKDESKGEKVNEGDLQIENPNEAKKFRKEGEEALKSDKISREEKENEGETSTEETRSAMIDRSKRKRLSDVETDLGEAREVKRVRISEQVDVKENVEVAHKKRRNRRKKKKEAKEKTEEVLPPLKVIPKQAWLDLRKEYLDLQRSSMKSLKKSLRKIKKREAKGDPEQKSVPLDSYMAGGDQLATSGNISSGVTFTPGVIIKVDTDQPFTRKELRETLSLVASVPYVDFQDGDQQGNVRCATPEDALRVIASRPASFRVALLQGDDEAEYWRKISADREQKRSVKTHSKKRGTQKLMERAEKSIMSAAPQKHIVFDD